MLFPKANTPQSAPIRNITMLRSFTDALAALAAFLSALHVAIGFITFEEVVDEETGIASTLFDSDSYRAYLTVCILFALTLAVSLLLRRFPAAPAFFSVLPVTYVMILFMEERLDEWEFAVSSIVKQEAAMTFLLFALLVFAGYSAVTLKRDREKGADSYRYTLLLIALLVAAGALAVFFTAEGAAEEIANGVKPTVEADGEAAVERYKYRKELAKVHENVHTVYYFRLAILQLLAAAFSAFWPKRRLLAGAVACLPFGYLLTQLSAEHLDFYPMLFALPMLLYFFGHMAYIGAGKSIAPPDEPVTDAPKDDA